MDAYRVAVSTMTSSNAAANAPCPIRYVTRHIGMSALPSVNAINLALSRREPRKLTAAASMASTPRVGVTIAAAPAETPAISGCHCRRWDFLTLARAAQVATMENSVVNQWWLICVQIPCDVTAHPIATSAEKSASLDAWRQAK